MPRLPPSPELDWTPEETPRARAFDDVYFSRAGGLDESEAVFLAGCGLPEAWKTKDRFAILELGFGSGLNVLSVWRAWKRTRLPHAILHMCTVEAFPLARADAARALAHFPDVAPLAAKLLAHWPVRAAAPQRLWFPEDGFALTICVGEAETVAPALTGAFDAFFLDGFSPARNAAMWSPGLLRQLGRLAAPGARAATFSVARAVRESLAEAGFAVSKQAGFANKRQRLEASFPAAPVNPEPRPLSLYPYAPAHPKRVAILGAGIAGAACAHALARRNVETVVLDPAPALGAGASGNPAGLVMPRLDRGGALKDFFLAAYLDAVALYQQLGVFTPCGVLERADARNQAALNDLLADPPLPPDWFAAHEGGALHARAGLVDPRAAIAAMLSRATLMLDTQVAAFERQGEGWILRAPDTRALLKADAIILACGPALKSFAPASFLPLELSQGQIEWGPCANPPPHAITRGSYLAPYADGVIFGATFDKTDSLAPQENARARNLAALAHVAPDIATRIDPDQLHSRAALRASTPDRAPIAGLMPDAPAWLKQNAALAQGGEPNPDLAPPALDGVYVLGGLGARGLTLAPILAERLASELFQEPQALSSAELALLHPARFLHRALKRGG